jgi:NADH-quinone oxidoreductase subunit N
VVALRGAGDGGPIDGYAGAARRAPWAAAVFTLALAGLAGLPPGLAGLFAKVAVVRALLDGGVGWLAAVVAVNAVIGLAYYLRVAAVLYGPPQPQPQPQPPPHPQVYPIAEDQLQNLIRAVGKEPFGDGKLRVLGLVAGFAPQLVLALADAGR